MTNLFRPLSPPCPLIPSPQARPAVRVQMSINFIILSALKLWFFQTSDGYNICFLKSHTKNLLMYIIFNIYCINIFSFWLFQVNFILFWRWLVCFYYIYFIQFIHMYVSICLRRTLPQKTGPATQSIVNNWDWG